MDIFRPHVMTYTSPNTPGGVDQYGFPLPDIPGEDVNVSCRFHQDSSKVFKTENGAEAQQIGRIRLDAGVTVPKVGTLVKVTNATSGEVQFEGLVRERYEGVLSGRVEV